jgi:hypothetical protein
MVNAVLAATVDRYPHLAVAVVAVVFLLVALAFVADIIVGAAEREDTV